MANLSSFPNTVDTFLQRHELSANDLPAVARFQELKLKASRTPSEETELANITAQLRDKLISSDDFNKLQDAMVNMEQFLITEINDYITTMQTQVTTAKDNALIAIEAKKENVIAYMDSTTAGAIRNDMGDLSILTTTDKTSLVYAINENKANIDTKQSTSEKGTANGYASLDANTLVPVAQLPSATTTAKGTVQLSISTSSTSTTTAATPSAVKSAYDLANTANTTANAALPKSGGTMTGAITLPTNPTANLHAATKQYVDAVGTIANAALPKDGSQAMTGMLTVPYLHVNAQDGANEGGEIYLGGAGSNPYTILDNYAGTFRANGNTVWDSSKIRFTNGYPEWNNNGTWQGVGGVKNVQRGLSTVTGNGGPFTVNVTISSVNAAKSFVNISYTTDAGSSDPYPNVRARLTSSTNLEIYVGRQNYTGSGTTANTYVSWEVVESY